MATLEASTSTKRGRTLCASAYSPRSFIVGGLTSAMGGIILLFAGIVWGWRRYYQPQSTLSNTQSIAKNSLVPMALNLFNKAIDFLFALFYLRILGPGDNGKYAAAISVALWFDIVANWGLDALIIRDGARDKKPYRQLLIQYNDFAASDDGDWRCAGGAVCG